MPRADRLQREEWMYRAGQASRDRRRWMWPTAFSAMTALAATLLVMLLVRPGPQEKYPFPDSVVKAPDVERKDPPKASQPSPKKQPETLPPVETVREEAPPSSFTIVSFFPRPPSGTYPNDLDWILEHGVENWLESVENPGLPPEQIPPETSRSRTNRELLDDLLNPGKPKTSPGRLSLKSIFGVRS